nr:MAG TPA: hypothetical protein [Caudoviricetes sp.]
MLDNTLLLAYNIIKIRDWKSQRIGGHNEYFYRLSDL